MKHQVVLRVGITVMVLVSSCFQAARSDPQPPKDPATTFVFVRMPESLDPMDRGKEYEDPLNAALERENLGEVTGGGTELSQPDGAGSRTIQWIGLDIELTDLKRGIPFLKRELRRLGAPKETTLEFERGGKEVSETIGE